MKKKHCPHFLDTDITYFKEKEAVLSSCTIN